MKILIVYHTTYGHTLQLARAVEAGVKSRQSQLRRPSLGTQCGEFQFGTRHRKKLGDKKYNDVTKPMEEILNLARIVKTKEFALVTVEQREWRSPGYRKGKPCTSAT